MARVRGPPRPTRALCCRPPAPSDGWQPSSGCVCNAAAILPSGDFPVFTSRHPACPTGPTRLDAALISPSYQVRFPNRRRDGKSCPGNCVQECARRGRVWRGAHHFDTELAPILPLSTDIGAIAKASSLWVSSRIPCVKGVPRTSNSPVDPPSTGKGGRRARGFPGGVRRRARRLPSPEQTACSGDLRRRRCGMDRCLRECVGRAAGEWIHDAFDLLADPGEVTTEYADLAEGVTTSREGGRGNPRSPGLWATVVGGVREAPSVGDGPAISGVLLLWRRRRFGRLGRLGRLDAAAGRGRIRSGGGNAWRRSGVLAEKREGAGGG